MAVIRELDAGQSHTFAKTGLRVTLTGASGGEVSLRAVDQSGAVVDSNQASQLSQKQIILWPVEQRVRLVASPGGPAFAQGTRIGLSVITESSAATEQVVVSQVDVGSLADRELAVIEFASDRSVLSVAATVTPSQLRARQTTALRPQPPSSAQGVRAPWADAGLYAVRDAERLGLIGPGRGPGWALVLDGSASLLPLARSGQLTTLVELVAGICWERSGAAAVTMAYAGTSCRDVPEACHQPALLVTDAFEGREQASWSFLADAADRVAGGPSAPGLVVLITDGVPGDIAALPRVAARHTSTQFLVVCIAASKRGLPSDASDVAWWGDELAAMDIVEGTPTISVVAVATSHGQLKLANPRPAELARAITMAGVST